MRPDDDTFTHPTSADNRDGADGANDTDDAGLDFDPDGAPCLVCGQTVAGPGPALLCPDCAPDARMSAADSGTAVPACPECGEPVQPVPPTVAACWSGQGRPVPQWSHLDGQPLCPVVGPAGYQPADPT